MKFKKFTRKRLNLFLSKHATELKTLDVGAGDKYYSKYFPNTVTVDIDSARNPDVLASIYELPFEDSSFDVVLCTEVYEHLENPTKATAELKRILKPDGKLILTTRFIFPIHDAPNDYFRYTKYGLRKIFADWEIISIESEANSLETISVLLQRLVFQAKFKANKVTKLFLVMLFKMFLLMSKLITKEFGDIRQTVEEKDILSSGYYMIAKNKK